jgi:hypothetical protein
MKQPLIAPMSTSQADLTIRMHKLGGAAASASAMVEPYEHLRPWMPWSVPEMGEAEAELVRRFIS